MARLNVFVYVTADGFSAGPNGEIKWFKAIPTDKNFEA